jgi:phenylalanyl-tRNA synthetase beta chain
MRVSYRWLMKTLGFEIPFDELVNRLIMVGLEVEAVTDLGILSGKVVTARILEMGPHPNADSLTLCRVDTGAKEPHRIVCGAKNMKPGDHVPLALEGARLPNGLTLKRSKIRGETSEGMMCSGRELCVCEDASGLWILPQDESLYPLGKPFDALIDIKITPNRPDALSMLGLARDLCAACGKDAPAFPDGAVAEAGEPAAKSASVAIESPDGCPRYAGRVIRGVTIGPSPLWLARAVESAGMRSINNVVDVTNYILVEVGHPLHAFDLALVKDGKVIVRRANEGETVTTLDGQEAALRATDLLIADPQKPIALAGIMGCGNTEINEATRDVFLECAYFDPATIRATSKRLGKQTDSSYRFERGVDPQGLRRVVDRAARLIAEVSGGAVAPGAFDEGSGVAPAQPVTVRVARVGELLGMALTAEEVAAPLRPLGFGLEPAGEGVFRVTVPPWRPDIEGEADIVEEVGRIVGYDRIPCEPPHIAAAANELSPEAGLAALVRAELSAAGLLEATSYSFLSAEAIERAGFAAAAGLRLSNPLSAEYAVMRPSLVPGMLELLVSNQNRGNLDAALFEVGTVFEPVDAAQQPDARERTGMRERTQFVAALAGSGETTWRAKGAAWTYHDGRALAERILCRLGTGAATAERLTPENAGDPADSGWVATVFHPGKSAVLRNAAGAPLMAVGELHPKLKAALDLRRDAVLVVGEFANLAPLAGAPPKAKETPVFPGISRDLALVADRELPAAEIEAAISRRAKGMLAGVRLFDVYEGTHLPEGRRSLAYTLLFRATDRTLTDAEVNQLLEKILADLAKMGVDLRS